MDLIDQRLQIYLLSFKKLEDLTISTEDFSLSNGKQTCPYAYESQRHESFS
jgi:hypothetical protein